MIKDFINLAYFSSDQLRALLQRAIEDKARFRRGELPPCLTRKTLALFFEKASNRTRVSFEVAMAQLGGYAIYLTQEDIGIGKREAVEDVARVLGRMCDGIAARTFSHRLVVDLARHCPKPVINGLTDHSHPCQAMADLMTMQERFGEVRGRKLAFIGDGNNVARSLAVACVKLGVRFVLACPPGYELSGQAVSGLGRIGDEALLATTRSPAEAADGADVLYTDTWVSMGQEQQREQRRAAFAGYQIDADLVSRAAENALVLHCLPAYRGCEIAADVLEAHADAIFEQAENRLHFQRTLLAVLLGEGGVA